MRGSTAPGWMLAAALALALVSVAPARADPPAVGDIPPDRLGVGADGRPLRVSDYRGRVLITTFWASWCGPCVRELSLLERLQRAAGRERVAVVGVDWNESAAQYQRIARNLQSLQLSLSLDADGRVGEAYAVRAIPRMFIVDQDGRLAYSHTGYDPESSIATIVNEVDELLQHPPASLMPGS
ncbi:TlpA family protein disulfide reductase [Solimonas terrae]|uniref:TlpA family protein disulfide reductase n=1 Tax=Solimonas terrae TaxID=1396819 RepID=A0A6M2BRF1_9GAMM|nr:TlpA disulfide reductase family protein [Solimonas terrae]NGY04683.1 TlpA family protein disulfide reductase [Solimonas terrae]